MNAKAIEESSIQVSEISPFAITAIALLASFTNEAPNAFDLLISFNVSLFSITKKLHGLRFLLVGARSPA